MSYWNLDKPKPEPLFRYDDGGDRYYARVIGDEVLWYPSVTRMIKATSPTPHGLLAWYAEHGMEQANKLRDDAADRGTEMHMHFERYITGMPVDLAGLSEFQAKALMSFDAWFRESVTEVYAVEMLLYSDQYGYAGTCDLVCRLNNGKVAIVDFKSGKTIHDDYVVQLEMYRVAWNELAEMHGWPQVETLYNWLPKDWRKEPSYTLKCQDNYITSNQIFARSILYRALQGQNMKPRDRKIYTGSLPGQAVVEIVRPEDVVKSAKLRLENDDTDAVLISVGIA